MSAYVDEERVVYEASNEDRKDDVLGNISSHINKGGEPPTATMEAEKRIRREIANSNERRRMQSINNGFQSLRSLLPHHEGEKLSKAAILQQTAEYIYSLEQEKTRLLSQNCQLKRLVNQQDSGGGLNAGCGELPPKKRKTELILPSLSAESSDEGLGSMSPEPVGLITVSVGNSLATAAAVANNNNNNNIGESVVELRRLLDRERGMRLVLEEQVRQFETQIYQQQSGGAQLYHVEGTEELALQLVTADNLPPVGHTQTVVCSPPNSRSPSPEPQERLPSVLEAAIKAEPKVEVERLPSPSPSHEDATPSRLYVSNTSRQNLETIVEAIRHLEGDHMFGDEPTPVATATAVAVVQQQQQQLQQEVPLALTTKTPPRIVNGNLMEFSAALVQQSQQSRPGVIVVKQAS